MVLRVIAAHSDFSRRDFSTWYQLSSSWSFSPSAMNVKVAQMCSRPISLESSSSSKKLEKKSYLESNLFVLLIYVKAWTACSNTCDAPISDLNLIWALSNYSTTSEAMSKMAIAAISRHFWHFSQEITTLGLFSDLGSVETKRLMVARLQEHTFQGREADRSYTPGQKMLWATKHFAISLDLLPISSLSLAIVVQWH